MLVSFGPAARTDAVIAAVQADGTCWSAHAPLAAAGPGPLAYQVSQQKQRDMISSSPLATYP